MTGADYTSHSTAAVPACKRLKGIRPPDTGPPLRCACQPASTRSPGSQWLHRSERPSHPTLCEPCRAQPEAGAPLPRASPAQALQPGVRTCTVAGLVLSVWYVLQARLYLVSQALASLRVDCVLRSIAVGRGGFGAALGVHVVGHHSFTPLCKDQHPQTPLVGAEKVKQHVELPAYLSFPVQVIGKAARRSSNTCNRLIIRHSVGSERGCSYWYSVLAVVQVAKFTVHAVHHPPTRT